MEAYRLLGHLTTYFANKLAKMLTLGIIETSFFLPSLNRIFRPRNK